MRMLLASKEKFLIEKGYSLFNIPMNELKIGYINTALKVIDDLDYLNYIKEYEDEMIEKGIHFEKFDIKDKTEKEIRRFFANKNVIQITGGNAFYLLKTIYESGFDKILKDLLDQGLHYIGCSSGSYIMCPTVEVAGWKVNRNRYGVTDFTALGYVPFLIKCHYTDDSKEKITEKIKTLKHPLRILRDNQGIFVDDGKYSFIGEEKECKIRNIKKCIIIHGTYGHSEENWFPWLKNKLERNNQYQVYIPNFPTPENQNLESWLDVLESDSFKFDSNTILVGHSLGAAFILSVLEKINLPIKAIFLVSGFMGPIGNKEFDLLNKNFTERNFNWKKIKNNVKKIFLYHSDNDPYVPIEKAFELAKYLGVDPIIINSAGHFNLRAGYDKFEKLYNDIINLN